MYPELQHIFKSTPCGVIEDLVHPRRRNPEDLDLNVHHGEKLKFRAEYDVKR